MIIKTVEINGEEHVLWYWYDEYDLETCVHATPKKVFDKYIKKDKYSDYIYRHSIFIYNEKEFKEIFEDFEE